MSRDSKAQPGATRQHLPTKIIVKRPETKQTEMFISGYKASLVKDTSYEGLWKVLFTLKEF